MEGLWKGLWKVFGRIFGGSLEGSLEDLWKVFLPPFPPLGLIASCPELVLDWQCLNLALEPRPPWIKKHKIFLKIKYNQYFLRKPSFPVSNESLCTLEYRRHRHAPVVLSTDPSDPYGVRSGLDKANKSYYETIYDSTFGSNLLWRLQNKLGSIWVCGSYLNMRASEIKKPN